MSEKDRTVIFDFNDRLVMFALFSGHPNFMTGSSVSKQFENAAESLINDIQDLADKAMLVDTSSFRSWERWQDDVQAARDIAVSVLEPSLSPIERSRRMDAAVKRIRPVFLYADNLRSSELATRRAIAAKTKEEGGTSADQAVRRTKPGDASSVASHGALVIAPASGGRKPIKDGLKNIYINVLRMKKENPTWGKKQLYDHFKKDKQFKESLDSLGKKCNEGFFNTALEWLRANGHLDRRQKTTPENA